MIHGLSPNLEPSDPVHHPFQLDSLDILVKTIHSLDPEFHDLYFRPF
jgi:hypothetical protein